MLAILAECCSGIQQIVTTVSTMTLSLKTASPSRSSVVLWPSVVRSGPPNTSAASRSGLGSWRRDLSCGRASAQHRRPTTAVTTHELCDQHYCRRSQCCWLTKVVRAPRDQKGELPLQTSSLFLSTATAVGVVSPWSATSISMTPEACYT